MSLVLNTDFVGEYAVSQSCYSKLDTYIAKFEKEYLTDLLGAELYGLFIADLDASVPQVPQSQRFLDIYNSFSVDDNNCVRKSEGMRAMLVQFIYFHWMRDTSYSSSDSGVMRTVSEVSEILPYSGWNLIQSYNEGIKNYKEIQWYICDNDADYPEENTQYKDYTSGI